MQKTQLFAIRVIGGSSMAVLVLLLAVVALGMYLIERNADSGI
jgi:hypothetical protein